MQLLGENGDVATKNDMSVSKELNVVQRLSLKHQSHPIGCTENTKNNWKNFSRNVGQYLYILMIVDSTISHGRQIECLSMERLENELSLTYLPRGQSMLMMKCVAEHILAAWLEIFSIYMEIFFLDVEVIIEAELNEIKHLCIIPFKDSKGRQSIEISECRTLMMKFVIIGKTSNEKTVVWKKTLLCYVNLWKTTLWSANWIMGWKSFAVAEEHSKQLTKMTMELDLSEKQRQLMTNSNDQ